MQVIVQGYLVVPVAAVPPADPVLGLIDRDAINPGPQRRLSAEAGKGAEDPQEDFLREVERLVAVAQEVEGQRVDHALVRGDQLRAGGFVTGGAARDQGGFAAIYVRPAEGAGVLHEISCEPRLHEVYPVWRLDTLSAEKFRALGFGIWDLPSGV